MHSEPKPTLLELSAQYDRLMRANARAVRSLNELGKLFDKITLASIRSNEPFRMENITHRCSKKRNLEVICARFTRRLPAFLATIDTLIESYAALSQTDVSQIRRKANQISQRFLSQFWFLKRILLFNLCDDAMYFSQQKKTLGLLTDIRPDVASSVRWLRPEAAVAKLNSLNEVIRFLHQRGEDAFFERARQLGASRRYPLGNENFLNLVDLDSPPASPQPKLAVQDLLAEPVMAALLGPYAAGVKGEGAEVLNVVKFRDLVDTQLELGLHKARLRSRITSSKKRPASFISLSYFEPFQSLLSQTVGQRLRYFAGILSRLSFSVDTDFVTFLNAQLHASAAECKRALGEVVRAFISLKDLDELLSLPEKTEKAVSLFCQGVTNIHGYFNLLRCLEFALSGKISPETLKLIVQQQHLNPAELQLLLDRDIPKMMQRLATPDTDSRLQSAIDLIRESIAQQRNL